MFKTLSKCNNTEDFRLLAKSRLPSPIFHYIDGGSDDESTLRRNTESFNDCDLLLLWLNVGEDHERRNGSLRVGDDCGDGVLGSSISEESSDQLCSGAMLSE